MPTTSTKTLPKAMQNLINELPQSRQDKWVGEPAEFLRECGKQKKSATSVHKIFVKHYFPANASTIARKMKELSA